MEKRTKKENRESSPIAYRKESLMENTIKPKTKNRANYN